MVPHLYSPVSRRRDENLFVLRIPTHGVHCHGVALIRLQVLAAESLGALVDPSLLGADQEQVLALPVEVEAEAASQAGEGSLVVLAAPGLAGHELQLHDLLALEPVLHEEPVGDTPVGRDGEEVERATGLVVIPAHLPHRIGVLVGAHGALVDRLLRAGPNVVHQHGAVVEAHGQHRGVRGVPVQTANPRVRVEDILWEPGVLQRVAADYACALAQELVRAEAHGAEVVVARVPPDARDLFLLRLLRREAPQRQ
mmetsp:Transcript_65673/g.170914  ORF Transcript_65673/g.170914 Transcript_65673/m.170914 type:complete len:254 (+) Transcript_65673:547-1308(+)